MSQNDIDHWDERYRAGQGPRGLGADQRLARYAGYVKALQRSRLSSGEMPHALDIACGAGGTVVWLARRGWHSVGVDASGEALTLASNAVRLAACTERCGLIQADLDQWQPAAGSVDLVTCFFFLNRSLLPKLRDAVRPGGLLILETFNRHRLQHRPGSNPAHLLAAGELGALIDEWRWQTLGTHSEGPDVERPTDAIIAQRPYVGCQESAVRPAFPHYLIPSLQPVTTGDHP